MPWYYAEANERRGPVDDEAFDGLVRTGTIKPDTLVWREGMPNWVPHREVAVTAGAPGGVVAASTSGVQVCSQCGRLFPPDEMITYEGKAICAECKPVFFQRVKEGALVHGDREYAGFWIRFGAKFVDGVLMNIVGQLVNLLCQLALGDGDPAKWVGFAVGVVIGAAYSIYFTGKYGATPGKMACKIQVIRDDDSPMTYSRAAGRYFAEYVSAFTIGIGYIIAAFDDQKRSLHDRICDTRVVYKRR